MGNDCGSTHNPRLLMSLSRDERKQNGESFLNAIFVLLHNIYIFLVLLWGGIDDSKLYWLDTMEVYKQRVDNVFWYKYFPRQLWSGSSELLCVITVSSNSNNCLQTTFRFIEGDFDTYVSQIRRPQVWGGEPELLMASHVLQ